MKTFWQGGRQGQAGLRTTVFSYVPSRFQDLLSQLHHYSGGVKQAALVGLRDLLCQHPQLLEQHLSSVLSEAAAVIADKDGAVRGASVRLLRLLAQCVPAERVAPFFPLLSAHLTCAMTHISEGIQEDALRVLDILLEHYPALLSARSAVLLRNFLELISQRRLSQEGKDVEERRAGGGWALTVAPRRTVTGQQWRLTVLVRYDITSQVKCLNPMTGHTVVSLSKVLHLNNFCGILDYKLKLEQVIYCTIIIP